VENYLVKGVLPLKKAKLLADVLEQWWKQLCTGQFHTNVILTVKKLIFFLKIKTIFKLSI